MAELKQVAVIGAGNMGAGIAQKTAQEGLDVVLIDLKEEFVKKGLDNIASLLDQGVERKIFSPEQKAQTLSRIKGSAELKDAAQADLVIEAVFEDLQVKSGLFAQLNKVCKPEAVLATNTSSFKVTDLAAASDRPDRFVGLHFFYHPAKNRLLEVVPGKETSPQALALARKYSAITSKTDIETADAPGFAVNRFFVPWLNESVRILREGLADIPTIDAAAKEAFQIGMGPFELMNITGIPIAYHSTQTLGQELGAFYQTCPLLAKQAGEGLWDLSGTVDEAKKSSVAGRLLSVVFMIACQLVEEGVATMTDTDIGAKVGLRWRVGPFELMNLVGVDQAYDLVAALVKNWPGMKMPRLLEERKKAGQPFDLRYVTLKVEDGVGWITFNRPEAMNALNPVVVPQLDECIDQAWDDPAVKALVLQGKGKAFVAGADIIFFVNSIKKDDFKSIYDFTSFGHEVLKKLERPEKPTIAKLDGLSLGGGSEVALACQTIVTTEKGLMGFPETGLGIYPAMGGTQRTTRRIGPNLTKYLVLTGKSLGGRTLVDVGLAEYFIPSAEVDERIKELVASGEMITKFDKTQPDLSGPLAEAANLFQDPNALENMLKGSTTGELAAKVAKTLSYKAPVALKFANRLIDEGLNLDLDEALATELVNLETIFGTEDALEGLSKMGRGRPEYKGR